MSNYDIKNKGLKKETEVTSAVATISYEVENAKANGATNSDINIQINDLKDNGQFPSNLQLVDAFYDPKTSSSGVAFLDNNTGKVVVGFAGTNFDNGFFGEGSKDVGQWGNIAFKGDGPSSAYFDASNKFMNGLKANSYDVDTVTGHSLGGRNGTIMGMAHNIPNIILYNSAPLMNVLTSVPTKGNLSNAKELEKLLSGYKGNILYFVSEDDPLNKVSGVGGSVYPGKIIVIKNGKSHDITGFLTKKEQEFIRQHTPDLNKIYVAQKKVQTDTTKKLIGLELLRAKFLKSGGGLSASEEIYLDASEALILTQGMSKTLQIEIDDIKKMYQEAKKDSDKLWTDTLKTADSIGSTLHQGEVLDSLNGGGATEPIVRIEPKEEYKQKISELSSVQQEYYGLISQIQSSINKQVETDQELARQIGG
ncbi:hypothetical protein CI088_09170 [Enterococcus plantarum]|uniref:DUF2974 domain-containing protein n=1 Tax=Enterococcus plantarum TaxID=1077675 RepID=A0A2W3ZW55_9ENTE|nr:hypothetical protein [Enterococcus plantarum]PZL73033.1 hypothetical protein CI088_09170 [Enterococcus plantarum]